MSPPLPSPGQADRLDPIDPAYACYMLALPRAARLAVWTNAWLAGDVPLDTVIAHVTGGDEPHRVVGLPEHPDGTGLTVLLGSLRRSGVARLQLALPAAGDPLGLAGPPTFNEVAVAAGEAAVAVGAPGGLVPQVRPFGPPGDVGNEVTWRWHSEAVAPTDVSTLAEADRELSETLLAAAQELARLDVASWREEATDLLSDLRGSLGADLLPGTLPKRARALVARALRLRAVIELALADDGAALTGADVLARRGALAPLDRCVRRALVAACTALPATAGSGAGSQHAFPPSP